MDTLNFEIISQFKFLQAAVAALILLLILRTAFRFAEWLVQARNRYAAILRLFPLAETLIWLVFLYWATHYVLGNNQIFMTAYLTVIVAISAWFFWFGLKDIIAGVVLQSQDIYQAGQEIKIADLHGTIRKVNKLGLELELKNGDFVKLPYSKITGKIHAKIEAGSHSRLTTFTIAVTRIKSLKETIEQLRFIILTMPWTSLDGEPQIKVLEEDERQYKFEISVHTVNENYTRTLEKSLREKMAL